MYNNYSNASLIISTAFQTGSQYLQSLSSAFSNLEDDLQALCLHLSKINAPKPQIPSARIPKSQTPDTLFYKNWQEISNQLFLPTSIIEQFLNNLRLEVAENLNVFIDSYTQRSHEILEECEKNLQQLIPAGELRKSTHAAYEKAAADFQAAFDQKSPKLQEMRDLFIKARETALQAHESFNLLRANVSTAMEGSLTQFENLEKEKEDKILCALSTFSGTLMVLSYDFKECSEAISEKVKTINIVRDVAPILEITSRNCMADDKFQTIPVLPAATEYLSLAKIWSDEIAKGSVLFRVKIDNEGKGDMLNAKANETVLGMKFEGNRVLCQNINESVGYLPRDILDRV